MSGETGFISRRDVIVEWGDCDAAGIVFYPRYFAMFDWSTATLFTNALGIRKPEMLRRYDIVGIQMVDTRARFIIPSTFGDPLTVESRITAMGRSSFEVHHRMLKPVDCAEALAAECWEKRVWVGRHPDDPGRMKGVAIPDDLRARLLPG